MDRADGAIGKAKLQREGVRTGFAIGGVEQLQIVDRAGGQVTEQIDEVASLTEQATTTSGWILRPVIRGDGTGVAGVDERLGALQT